MSIVSTTPRATSVSDASRDSAAMPDEERRMTAKRPPQNRHATATITRLADATPSDDVSYVFNSMFIYILVVRALHRRCPLREL